MHFLLYFWGWENKIEYMRKSSMRSTSRYKFRAKLLSTVGATVSQRCVTVVTVVTNMPKNAFFRHFYWICSFHRHRMKYWLPPKVSLDIFLSNGTKIVEIGQKMRISSIGTWNQLRWCQFFETEPSTEREMACFSVRIRVCRACKGAIKFWSV